MNIYEKLNIIQVALKAPKSQVNKFGRYNYRSCEDILEALKPLLEKTKTSLLVSDEVILIGDRFYIKAKATLINNEPVNNNIDSVEAAAFAREPLIKKGMDEAQITGATSSYARKYALNGLFAIDDTKDADFTNTHNKDDKSFLTHDQKAEISELLELTHTDFNNFLSYFKVRDFSEIPYEKAKSMLLTKFKALKDKQ